MSNYFEDLTLGRVFRHGTPRTVTEGEIALYIALTGARQPCESSRPLALQLGYRDRPLDDLLVFNIAFGKTVADISANALANLGYADLRFLAPVYAGDTLRSESEVIGRRAVSSGKAGVVYVRTCAFSQSEELVLEYVRWVLVRRRGPAPQSEEELVPELPSVVPAERLPLPRLHAPREAMRRASGSSRFWSDFQVGERIDHGSGITVDESDHTLATRLYQNNATGHFDAIEVKASGFPQRLVYGGHVMSICRALSYEGLENVISIAAVNGGTHVGPTFAGDTIYAETEVIERIELKDRDDLGALRLRLWGLKNGRSGGRALVSEGAKPAYDPAVVLDLDYVVVIPR